jgi:hypothetical protein
MTDSEYQAFIEKYTPSEVDILKDKIKMSRFTYIITDPYPNHSFYDSLHIQHKIFAKKPKEISIHQAYREGMEFMWSLIEPLVK